MWYWLSVALIALVPVVLPWERLDFVRANEEIPWRAFWVLGMAMNGVVCRFLLGRQRPRVLKNKAGGVP